MFPRLFLSLLVSIMPFWVVYDVGRFTFRHYTAQLNYRHTTGQLTSLRSVGGEYGQRGVSETSHRCSVQYSYDVHGSTYIGNVDGGDLPGVFGHRSLCLRQYQQLDSPVVGIGSSVKILYDPTYPERSLTQSDYPRGILFTLFAIALFWIGCMYAFWTSPKPKPV